MADPIGQLRQLVVLIRPVGPGIAAQREQLGRLALDLAQIIAHAHIRIVAHIHLIELADQDALHPVRVDLQHSRIAGIIGQQPETDREQVIPRIDGNLVAECPVHRLLASAGAGLIDDVIMHQCRSMQQFHRGRDRLRPFRIPFRGIVGKQQAVGRPQHFPAREQPRENRFPDRLVFERYVFFQQLIGGDQFRL
ncbi:hypothetical protein SDC9_168857 [bioreactor metagenome]|uniref:Uncharacterized protein n=1 Tax=bioreactor metagenome TaxID=1076179 RepID=A0A645G3K5_9ZZZZ